MPVLPQKVYETLRWVVIIVIPAAITLYGVIGNTCNIPHTDIVLTIAGAVDVFLGTIFGISKLNYSKRISNSDSMGVLGESEEDE